MKHPPSNPEKKQSRSLEERLISEAGISPREVSSMLKENNIPFMQGKETIMPDKLKTLIITDIGSTTTKALLLKRSGETYEKLGLVHVPTTVEKPIEDVRIGVFNAIRELEKNTDAPLLSAASTPERMILAEDTGYLTTSSAGGGLQILVVGLTVYDSAASAKRAAYGAGGVILDTFAIDDKRTALEQMLSMNILHPDIILFSGGVDGGAVSGVVRLGETLSMADPLPKFASDARLPLVFAGNRDAVPIVRGLFSDRFDLHVVPNLRPTMEDENPQPARDKIHELFMEHVMERAPGYHHLKNFVTHTIIPTPSGVLNSLRIISSENDSNVMAVDIGGATTDVFSNILGQYYRTVSANLGMSYSVLNVLAEAGIESIMRWLPEGFTEDEVRDYLGNKMLHPTCNPTHDRHLAIEHAAAREAIRLARQQHMEMHFNTEKIGFLDRLKHQELDKFVETFYVERQDEQRKFHDSSIDILIGAGGVISKAPNPLHAIMLMIDGLQPCGITELWRDRDFISPHLGKMSEIDQPTAGQLLRDICYEKLALVLRPYSKKKFRADRMLMTVTTEENGKQKKMEVFPDEFRLLPAIPGRKVTIDLEKDCALVNGSGHIERTTNLILVIDTRTAPGVNADMIARNLNLYPALDAPLRELPSLMDGFKPAERKLSKTIRLPYPGQVHVTEGQTVKPGDLVAENQYDPPRIFILNLFLTSGMELDPERMKKYLEVNEGDQVRMGQRILHNPDISILDGFKGMASAYSSPVAGMVEYINFKSGTLILREIQDYSTRPVKVDIAGKLGVPPKDIRSYLLKQKGEFCYIHDGIAKRIMPSADSRNSAFVHAPATGTLVDIDTEKGTVTLHYDKKPHRLYSFLHGTVTAVRPKWSAEISFEAIEVSAAIGFGGENGGVVQIVKDVHDLRAKDLTDRIAICLFTPDAAEISAMYDAGVNGIVCPSVRERDIVQILEKELGVGITGDEPLPAPLVLMDGFGQRPLPPVLRELFTGNRGRYASLNGHTQIRAGVTRPSILFQNTH